MKGANHGTTITLNSSAFTDKFSEPRTMGKLPIHCLTRLGYSHIKFWVLDSIQNPRISNLKLIGVVGRDLNPQHTRSAIDNPKFFGLFRQGVNKDVFGAFTNFATHHVNNPKAEFQN